MISDELEILPTKRVFCILIPHYSQSRIKISANGYNFPLYINSNALLSKDNFDDKVFLFYQRQETSM